MKRDRALWLSLLLAVLVAAVFGQVAGHTFTLFDDDAYVYENPYVKDGFSGAGVVWAFAGIQISNWHPLTLLSHMLDCELFGLWPGGHHLVNVLFHVINTVLLFRILLRATGAVGRSFLVAALFGLHPLHVESVVWISERKDVLSTLFWLLTMHFYFRYAREGRRSSLILALVVFALGLLSKPMLVTLPFGLLLLDLWPLGRRRLGRAPASPPDELFGAHAPATTPVRLGRLVVEKLPFFALAFASSAVTFLVQRSEQAMVALDRIPVPYRIGNALVAYVAYLGKTLWPTGLAIFYPHPGTSLGLVAPLASGALLVALTVAAVLALKRRPWVGIGWFWYLGTLVPVIGLVQVGSQGMADRYTYIPSIGVFVVAAWGLAEIATRARVARPVLVAATALLVAVLSGLTFAQTRRWRNNVALMEHTLAVIGPNALILDKLGTALSEEGRLEEALVRLEEAVRLQPTSALSRNNLGSVLARSGRYAEAMAHFDEAVRLDPENARYVLNAGYVRLDLGLEREALPHLEQAVALAPDAPDVQMTAGIAYNRLRDFEAAESCFRAAIALDPDNALSHYQLGGALGNQGRLPAAIAAFERALELDPFLAPARSDLELARAKLRESSRPQ